MRLLLFIIFLSISTVSFSQFGVAAKYNSNNFNGHNSVLADTYQNADDLYSSGFEIGIHYWLRLKNYRVEFLPEIFYSSFSESNYEFAISSSGANQLYNFKGTGIGFNANTQIYLLDIEGDCDCPTWGKDGGFIEKGFFISISPGIMSLSHDITTLTETSSTLQSVDTESSFLFKLGLGVGVDIGLSKLITITPFVNYNFYPSMSPDFLPDLCPNCDLQLENSSINQIQAGLRVSFRPDYKY